MRRYVVVEPTREELKEQLASAALSNSPLPPIRARECLDDLNARRRPPDVVDFQLQISSIHLSDGAFVIASTVNSNDMVRLDFEPDQITMTVIDSDESPVITP